MILKLNLSDELESVAHLKNYYIIPLGWKWFRCSSWAFLSGGVDSSIISTIANQDGKAHTYTIGSNQN